MILGAEVKPGADEGGRGAAQGSDFSFAECVVIIRVGFDHSEHAAVVVINDQLAIGEQGGGNGIGGVSFPGDFS